MKEITVDQLAGACDSDLGLFKELFGESCEINEENMARAISEGLDVIWLTGLLSTDQKITLCRNAIKRVGDPGTVHVLGYLESLRKSKSPEEIRLKGWEGTLQGLPSFIRAAVLVQVKAVLREVADKGHRVDDLILEALKEA